MNTDATETAAHRHANSPWRNPWVISWIALVVVVVLVNITMVVIAITTNPGLVVDDYYERGRHLAEARAAQRLTTPGGWEIRLDLPQPILRGVPTSLRVAAVDERGIPVRADDAELFAYRPSDASADFRAKLETVAPGVASAEVVFPLHGIWELVVQIRAGDRVYDMGRRIAVQRE